MSLTSNQVSAYRWALGREGRLQRPVSPNMASVASSVSNGSANNLLKRRNNIYTRKANQWKANVAAGKINLTPYPTHREKNAMSRAEFYKALQSGPPPVTPVHTNVAQWRAPVEAEAQELAASKAQKQADLAAYFAAMKSKKPSRNVRHTTGRAARKNRKSRRKSRRSSRRN